MTWIRFTGCSLALLLGSAAFAPAKAQTCTVTGRTAPGNTCNANNTVRITIGAAIQLVLPSATITLNTPAAADFNTGYQNTTGPVATVYANRSWTLNIAASTATGFWTAAATTSEPVRTTKPAADLMWSLAAAGPYNALLVSPATATLTTGNATAGTATQLYFRTLLAWALDTPGNYSLAVLYTLTAP
jgi:hypothetical protein